MKFSLRSLLACLSLLTASAHAELVLADQREALPITIHPQAGETVRFAAEDLARILGEMSGSTPKVVESDTPSGIVIGTAEQFGNFKNDPGLEIRKTYDGREAYIIRPDEKERRLWILGNREDGASHGVYSLLREHGYRALYPGKNWEVIPKHASVTVKEPSQGRPKVLTRAIWAGFGSFDKEQGRDVDIWRQRNRLGASIKGQIGHSWESMIRHNKEALEANPLILGEKADGTQNRNSLRHGTEAAVDFTVEHFRKQIESPRPRQDDALSLAPTDGDNYSRDKETAARGDISESFYWYVNAVAKKMAASYPDRLVATTAYYLHAKPPSFDLEPNTLVIGATMFGSGGMPLDEFFGVWSKKTPYFGIRDYIYSGYPVFGDHADGGATKAVLERQANWLRNYPIAYYSAEGLWEWGLRGSSYYALAQLLWDPSQEVDAILNDFYASAFGPGAQAMTQYYEFMEPRGRKVRKYQLNRAVNQVKEASKAIENAKADPGYTARINDVKLFLVHTALIDKMKALKPDSTERHQLAAETLEWNYRARRSYILNYNCNRRFWMVNKVILGNFFERDRNNYSLKSEEKPGSPEEQNAVIAQVLGDKWQMNGGFIVPREEATLQPADGAEINAKFEQHVVPLYPPVDVEETTFSTDYVPVDTGLAAPVQPENEALWFGSTARFLFWRPAAATLTWQITPNVRYRDRIDKRQLTITGEHPDGTAIEPITIQQKDMENAPQEVKVELNQPGLSQITINNRRMGHLMTGKDWEYAALPTGENTILFLGSAARNATHVNAPVYFYVPKGVKEIQIFADLPGRLLKGSIIRMVGGEKAEATIDGELIRIPVSSKEQGKVWEVAQGGVGVRFSFLNLPNILSLHPGKMLLPREVAEKDGLKQVE